MRVDSPSRARVAAMAAQVVDFPTPPFDEAKVTIMQKPKLSFRAAVILVICRPAHLQSEVFVQSIKRSFALGSKNASAHLMSRGNPHLGNGTRPPVR